MSGSGVNDPTVSFLIISDENRGMPYAFWSLVLSLVSYSSFADPEAVKRELPWICPSELGGSAEPVYTVHEKGAPTLLVCSDREFDRDMETSRIELAMFKVLSLTSKGGAPDIHFNSKNENEFYRVIAIERGVQVNELFEYSGGKIPFLGFSVTCKPAGCKRSNKKCVIPERPAAPHPEAIQEWSARMKQADPSASIGDEPMDRLVLKVFEQALAGDKKALRIFEDTHAEEKMPREAAKEYLRMRQMIRRSKQAGCFKS